MRCISVGVSCRDEDENDEEIVGGN